MRMSNSPRPSKTLVFELERQKSYSFLCILKDAAGVPMDLTGSTLRFVVKDSEFDHDPWDATFPTVNITAELTAPTLGEGVFSIQAAELEGDPGNYFYSLVLWTPDKYSIVLAKGPLVLLPNTDSTSAQHQYVSTTPEDGVEIRLRGQDVVTIVPAKIPFRAAAVATASRPAASSVGAGYMIFDTTLGRPLWSNGTDWLKADGYKV